MPDYKPGARSWAPSERLRCETCVYWEDRVAGGLAHAPVFEPWCFLDPNPVVRAGDAPACREYMPRADIPEPTADVAADSPYADLRTPFRTGQEEEPAPLSIADLERVAAIRGALLMATRELRRIQARDENLVDYHVIGHAQRTLGLRVDPDGNTEPLGKEA